MKDKFDMTQRQRKNIKHKKNNSQENVYSSKHILNYEELLKMKKKNNQSKGGKSRHNKST